MDTIGYGFRRKPQTLRDAGAQRVFIDDDKERAERNYLLDPASVAIRPGDNIILIAAVDLGSDWRDRTRVLKTLSGVGVTVQVRGNDPVLYDTAEKRQAFKALKGFGEKRVQKSKTGRPRLFDPTPEQDTLVREVWRTEGLTRAYKLKRISEIMGTEIKFHILRDRYKGFPGVELDVDEPLVKGNGDD